MDQEFIPCRLFLLLARSAKRAVIFRRGPKSWTQLILWHTDTDEFDFGQWFRGSVYVRVSDLSPDGTKLIYFARKYKKVYLENVSDWWMTGYNLFSSKPSSKYIYGWTAISRPPYYTALALWPEMPNCWGGGLFESNDKVSLYQYGEAEPRPLRIPQGLRVVSNTKAIRDALNSQAEPVYYERLTRGGWQNKQELKRIGVGYPYKFPEILIHQHPDKPYQVVMKHKYIMYSSHHETFSVENMDKQPIADVEGSDWVDWDQNGRLIVFKQGKVFFGVESGNEFTLKGLVDFNSQKPEAIIAPEWATEW